MIRLILPREIQSGNALAYRHWRVRHRDKLAWIAWIKATGHPANNAELPRGKRHVRIVAYRSRMLDDDNVVGGAKHLRDALVGCCLLLDDNARWSSWEYVQRLRSHPENPMPKKSCTVVEITDA